MERVFHKKAELLSFNFINNDGEFITSSSIYGQNFSYLVNANKVIISIDLKNSIDIDDFNTFYKDLNSIKLDNEHIIKQIAKLKELNENSNFILKLYFTKYEFKKYILNFNYDGIKLSFNTIYKEE